MQITSTEKKGNETIFQLEWNEADRWNYATEEWGVVLAKVIEINASNTEPLIQLWNGERETDYLYGDGSNTILTEHTAYLLTAFYQNKETAYT